jgi:hypothetical protein
MEWEVQIFLNSMANEERMNGKILINGNLGTEEKVFGKVQ